MTRTNSQAADPSMQRRTQADEDSLFAQLAAAPPAPTEPHRRAPENPEKVLADRTLKLLEQANIRCLKWLRSRLAEIYCERRDKQGFDLAYVTADDARILIKAHDEFKKLTRMNFMGSLFKDAPDFECTNEVIRSKTPGSKGNRLLCWRYIGPDPRQKP